ncbi:primase-helicase zinc-binding domain-containing protein [Altererythrobacter litoralis]|uniref:primase-helicase zinc-binding domain-containing protein n=1 Tax=Altererythrobacter litoralis TaxID=3113904 RepID=UPI003392F340
MICALQLKKAGATEYHGPCPYCGGTDRFRIQNWQGELKHHCRQQCDFRSRNALLTRMGLLPEWGRS